MAFAKLTDARNSNACMFGFDSYEEEASAISILFLQYTDNINIMESWFIPICVQHK